MMPFGPTWTSPLKSVFWQQVPSNYKEIRLVLPKNHKKNYEIFSYFAATHGMSTDAMYTSRVDQNKLLRAKAEASAAVDSAEYADGALYVLDHGLERTARRSLHSERDLLRKIDGFWVLAPGWKCRVQCTGQRGRSEEDCADTCPTR
jgi:hypothetical protein